MTMFRPYAVSSIQNYAPFIRLTVRLYVCLRVNDVLANKLKSSGKSFMKLAHIV